MPTSFKKITPVVAAMLVLSLAGCGALGGCQDGPPPGDHRGGPGGKPPHAPPRDPEFDKAFHACLAEQGAGAAAEAGEQAGQTPPQLDRQAMDACLEGKGVEPAMPPPPIREHR